MIDANELMLGDIAVCTEYSPDKKAVSRSFVKIIEMSCTLAGVMVDTSLEKIVQYDELSPAEADEHLLMRLGFKRENSDSPLSLKISDYDISYVETYFCNDLTIKDTDGNIELTGHFSYLHELQNYVRLATGHELDIDNLIGKQL